MARKYIRGIFTQALSLLSLKFRYDEMYQSTDLYTLGQISNNNRRIYGETPNVRPAYFGSKDPQTSKDLKFCYTNIQLHTIYA